MESDGHRDQAPIYHLLLLNDIFYHSGCVALRSRKSVGISESALARPRRKYNNNVKK
jgi:hypothetical protein